MCAAPCWVDQAPEAKSSVVDFRFALGPAAWSQTWRSQLLAYNVMFGPDYSKGACPGCTSLADGLEGSVLHMNKRDVTLMAFSRAPIDRLVAYKQRMGWPFPYVSTYDTDFPWDFGLALTEEQAGQIPEVQE